MNKDSYQAVMDRKPLIMKQSVGLDYDQFEQDGIGFDYEKMMSSIGMTFEQMKEIQLDNGVGDTPLLELKNITSFARKLAPKGKGARIFVKDEACNASGSFKARRAALAVHTAKKMGYKGVIAATSGNYGAAVASMAAKNGLSCIIVQECYDSHVVGQPEIIEKARACEALGAEVIQLTVGPELFYTFLKLLEETGYFNASLYVPYGIAGVETLGVELIEQCHQKTGRMPDAVICTNAGGGNLTGTARGIISKGVDVKIVAASVDLSGLHMASDQDFNRKSFTTGHTGFGVPFTTFPDRSDVPRSAARPLRYMDEYYTVTQGEVFYATQMLAILEGLERGPAGNTSLAVAISLAQQYDEDQIIIVQETEYTGAGKHHQSQLSFAIDNGIELLFGNPKDQQIGKNIIFPDKPQALQAQKLDLQKLRLSCIKAHMKHNQVGVEQLSDADIAFLVEETNTDTQTVLNLLETLK